MSPVCVQSLELDTVHWRYWLSSQFGLQWNIPSFEELKALFCLSLALEFIEGGKIDHVPLLVQIVQHCSALFSIAQSMMHFDQLIGLQLRTQLTISSSGKTLFYCSALFFLTVNRYTVTVQKRQFLVSRPSWSPSHNRMQPISYRRIFCLGQS